MNRFCCRSTLWLARERVRPVAFAIRNGERMPVASDGSIRRAGARIPSGAWHIVGAVTRNNFGAVTRTYTLAELLADPAGIPWLHKNGKQKTFILDRDHGTLREWRAPAGARMARA